MPRDLLAPQPRDLLAPQAPVAEKKSTFMHPKAAMPLALGETALQMAVSGAAAIPAGLAGIAGTVLPGEQGQGARWVDKTQSFLSDWAQPRSEAGKGFSETIAKPFEKYEQFADTAGEVTGKPSDTLGATAVKTALLAAPMAFGIRPGKAPVKAAQPKKVPTTAELKSTAKQAYTAAEESGVVISKNSFGKFVDELKTKLTDEAIDKDLTPKSMKALERLMERKNENFSMKGAEIERRAIKAAEKSFEPADKRMAGIIRREFDKYLDSLGVDDVVAGDAKSATAALGKARDAWTRAKKGEVIEGLISKAKTDASMFSGSGYENALRNKFRQLARNDKKMGMFSKAEQSAIRKVAEGGPLENAFRALGKFAPRGLLSTTIGGGAGYALGGPLGGAAVLGAGELGRAGATMLTGRNARLAAEMMRRGGPTPKPQPSLSLPNKKAMALAAELAAEGSR